MNKMINIRIPDRMLEELDKIAEQKNYSNRNELIRDSLRDVINQHNGV